jgi:long-subunit fatty acid transport protein
MKLRAAFILAGFLAPPLHAVQFVASDFGGSPVPVGAGPRALGMGGAFTAVADDGTANTWNPAAMTQLDRPEAAASMGYYRNEARAGGEDSASDEQVDLDHISLVLPFFAGDFQQTVGVAWQRQFDFTRGFDHNSEVVQNTGILFERQDHTELEQNGSFSSLSGSYALELIPRLSLGLTAHIWSDDWTQNSGYAKHTTTDSHTTLTMGAVVLNDSLSHQDFRETIAVEEGYGFSLGSWWQATQSLTFGLCVKPEYTLRIESHSVLRERTTDLLTNTVTDQPPITGDGAADFTYPTSATIGAAWRHRDLHTLCADVTWTHWSAYRTRQDGAQSSPINPFIDPSDFRDMYTVRMGYEQVFILSELVLVGRGGLLWEEMPGASKTPNANEAEKTGATVDNYFGATLGMSLCLRHVIYDLGTQVRHGDNVGAGQQIGPDRTVDVLTWIARLGLTVQF